MQEGAHFRRPRTLDGWYSLLSGIYFDRNYYRSRESILCHLLEVVGGLSIVASGKTNENVVPERFLAKSFGWWMALCDQVGLRSVESIVWMKFPAVCPYCRLGEHDDVLCKQRREISGGAPNWGELRSLAKSNVSAKPVTLTGWQDMFQKIYRRNKDTHHEKNFSHLTEELGELAEAVRSFPFRRSYFLSEASDVFAWLMGVANQLRLDAALNRRPPDEWQGLDDPLGDLLWREYPGKCRLCQGRSCKCAPFPKATRGRIVQEGPELTPEAEEQFFGLRDKLEFLDLGDRFIEIAGKRYELDDDVVSATKALLAALDSIAADLNAAAGEMRNELRLVQDQLALIAQEEVATQERVEDILERLQHLPGPVRQTIIDHLTGLNVGIWLEWLKEAFG